VYFTDPRPVAPPYSLDEWRESGAREVYRFAELRAAVGAETDAIILDATVADHVDRGWRRGQAWPPKPRVIVGVNPTLRELQDLVGAPAPQAPWKPAESHFAIVAFGPDCAAAGQERFSRFSPLSVFLQEWVERYGRCTSTG
jgi:hypothetical protein